MSSLAMCKQFADKERVASGNLIKVVLLVVSLLRKLVDALPKISNDAVRFATVAAIDRLSPKGSKDAAAKMQAMFDKATDQKDAKKIKAYQPMMTVVYRLSARAQ